MWQVIKVYAILGLFCLEMVPKVNSVSEMSKVTKNLGRLVIGSGKKLILNKNKEIRSTKPQAELEDNDGIQSYQPASTVWQEMMVSKLRQLNPTVYCGDDAMTLHVQGRIMPNFMIDGVPLTRIPLNCGLSVTQDPTEAIFTVPYQGCHVTQEGNMHVLPLQLWGVQMNMSCPLARYLPPTVSCLATGMVTKISHKSADVLKLKVNGNWKPLMSASRTCGITTVSETNGVVITAPYQSSCWQAKGGEKFLFMLYGNEEFNLSCPVFQDPHFYGHVSIVSYQSHEPSVTPPTDTIITANIANAQTGIVSNPEQPLSYPFGHMYSRYGWALPPRTSTTASVTSRPITRAPASVLTSKPVDMMHHFPRTSHPVGPMLYHHRPKLYGYPWLFLAEAPTTAPTSMAPTTKTATTSETTPKTPTIVARNPHQYPLIPIYYPFGPMLNSYPWAFPAKAPTTAPTTTTPIHKTTATFTTVASNPQQSADFFNQGFYPFGPMQYLYRPMPYGYPCAASTKAPTIAPTKTVPTTKTTTSQAPTIIVAKTPQQSAYFFNRLNYAYGPMPSHHKPMPYGYPWAFPAREPTAAPVKTAPTAKTPTALTTKTSKTAATTLMIVANNHKQSVHPLNRMYYPFGPMHCHHRPSHYLGHPWAFPANAPTTTATTSPTTSNQMHYPYVSKHFAKPLPPWIHFYNHNQFQKGQELVPTILTPVIK